MLGSFILLYSQGYILDKSFNLSRRGGLYVSAPIPDSDIFINNKKKKTTGMLNNGLFVSNLKAGTYSVLVAKEGFWPWAKTLEVKEGLVTESRAIIIPQEPKGEVILKGKFTKIWSSIEHNLLLLQKEENDHNQKDLAFYKIDKEIFLTAVSDFTAQLLSSKDQISNLFWNKNSLIFKSSKGKIKATFDFEKNTVSASYFYEKLEEFSNFEKYTKHKDQKLWWEPTTNEIFIDWLKENKLPPYYLCESAPCELPIKIFQSHLKIKSVDFFPGRKDVVILSIENGVYALEIDERTNQLIYPIYKGVNPDFASLNEKDKIYIIDDGSLFKVYLK